MRRILWLAVTFLTPVLLVASTRQAVAEDAKSARGTVSAVAANSLTVKVGAADMKFAIDSKTEVIASGAGTATRRAQAAGTPGPALSDFVKVGNAVMVNFADAGAMHHATRVQVISSAGPGGGSVSTPVKTADATVKSVSAASLTVVANGQDTTFSIDSATDVVGRGLGTTTAATGGRAAITDLVKNGDRVSVTYHEMGSMMHAAEVRVVGTGRQ